ncbi:hypothetical protein C900_00899 [Fulvivirga imtechensis AK7]|uniref:Uncharacterized protein n=1 Tax=Fulvivirga imtechensis AK7 TaxID=1237149 RepID=L8JXN0_9BACT|nr:hypothetical protein [Fulvivirga imtechensis]ELR72938.1 hypothetical protein C900_00899 [Fulvivirga imtechensis AK7]
MKKILIAMLSLVVLFGCGNDDDSPDNDPAPFLLKPLAGDVPADASAATLYDIKNIAASTYPTGNVKTISCWTYISDPGLLIRPGFLYLRHD